MSGVAKTKQWKLYFVLRI